jgi:hypothetical protein
MSLRLTRAWPFLETTGIAEARRNYEQALDQKQMVEDLSNELVERGERNHFAEPLLLIYRNKRD